MKICHQCGAWIRANAKFCTRCGSPLETHTTTPKPNTTAPTETVSNTALQHELNALSSSIECVKAAYQAEHQQSVHAQQQILQMQQQAAQAEQQATAQLAQANDRINELQSLLEQAKQEILSLHTQLHEMYTQNQELHHALAQTSVQDTEQTMCMSTSSAPFSSEDAYEDTALYSSDETQSTTAQQEQDKQTQDTVPPASPIDTAPSEDEPSCEDELASTLRKVCDTTPEQTHD